MRGWGCLLDVSLDCERPVSWGGEDPGVDVADPVDQSLQACQVVALQCDICHLTVELDRLQTGGDTSMSISHLCMGHAHRSVSVSYNNRAKVNVSYINLDLTRLPSSVGSRQRSY